EVVGYRCGGDDGHCYSHGPARPRGRGSVVAEREGFEPSKGLLSPYSLSRGAPSSAKPPLRARTVGSPVILLTARKNRDVKGTEPRLPDRDHDGQPVAAGRSREGAACATGAARRRRAAAVGRLPARV